MPHDDLTETDNDLEDDPDRDTFGEAQQDILQRLREQGVLD